MIAQNQSTPVPHFDHALSRAMGYPYPAPEFSYTLRGGAVYPFVHADTQDRHPLLCIGSNISPQQLLHKFGGESVVPVQRAWLNNHDVVFAAHISNYGAIPAMLVPQESTSVFLAIAWLTPIQLQCMDSTEAHAYSRVIMQDIALRTLEGEDYTAIEFYRSNLPPYQPEGSAIAIDDIRANDRVLPTNNTIEILLRLYRSLSQEKYHFSFLPFMTMLIEDEEFRQKITTLMRA